MKPEWTESLREKLDQHYAWPALYTFKFVVPKGKEQEVTSLFPQHTATLRASKNGNYSSITLQMMMPSSQAVISVYEAAATVEGIIAL
jgi:putative lipoic acid-binding regulatory protein